MLIVRDLTTLDLLSVLNLAQEFYDDAENAHSLGFDMQGTCDNLFNIIGDDKFHAVVAVKNKEVVGILIGMAVKEIWSVKHIGFIHFFYVQKDSRSFSVANRLYSSFENWCKKRNEDIVLMQIGLHSGLDKDRPADVFFKRKGFREAGKDLIKEIQ